MSRQGRPKWHKRVRNAIMNFGTERGYESHSGIVYYKIEKNRFEYHPDVLWLYNCNSRYKPCAFVWEIESRWGGKNIAGDCILAFMMKPCYNTFFKQKEETQFGRILNKNVMMPTYYGEKRATYKKNWHKKMNLNATHVILVMEHEGYEDYWRRYMHSIADYIGFKGTCDVISIPKSCDSVDDVRHRLAHLKFLRQVI